MAYLGCALLALAFFAFGFGAARVLLKGTAFEKYTFEGAFLLGPMLITLAFTLCGYLVPELISRGLAWTVVAFGWGFSGLMAVRDREALRDIFRENKGRLALLLPAGVWSAVVILLFFPGNIWTNWFFLGNGEYLNYAELASHLTGQCTPTADRPVPRFVLEHRQIRHGQDVITAVTAQLTGLHPVNVVLPLSVYYRFQYAIALGLVLLGLVGEKHRYTIVPLLLFLDGHLLVETMSFTTSFMSSNCTIGLYVLYLGVVVTRPEAVKGRLLVLGFLANVYFLITYPEFLLIVKAVEVAHLCWWFIQRNPERWKPVLLVNLLTVLLHPLVVLEHARGGLGQAASTGGWNMFGDPRETPLVYLANVFGLRFTNVPEDPFAGWPGLLLAAVAVLGVLIVAGLYGLARRRGLTLLAASWVGLMLYAHLSPIFQPGRHFYVAVKFVTQTIPILLACLAVLAESRWKVVRRLAWAGAGGWAVLAAFAAVRTSAVVPRYCDRHDYGAIRRTLAGVNREPLPVVCLAGLCKLRVVHMAAMELGIPVVPLSPFQTWNLRYPAEATTGLSRLEEDEDGLECVLALGDASCMARRSLGRVTLYGEPGCQLIRFTLDGRHFRFFSQHLLGSVNGVCLHRGRLQAYAPGDLQSPDRAE